MKIKSLPGHFLWIPFDTALWEHPALSAGTFWGLSSLWRASVCVFWTTVKSAFFTIGVIRAFLTLSLVALSEADLQNILDVFATASRLRKSQENSNLIPPSTWHTIPGPNNLCGKQPSAKCGSIRLPCESSFHKSDRRWHRNLPPDRVCRCSFC